ncbi:hypothetical protein LOK49_LG02G01029 [Camellia lanceoleosa]|uniref:Uncharacterized protein n=1 Tax=Camellia lanceoleosa TaxID=1840588 RepID=A0ACC0IU58_9ERIC|nr:hypothetical protein LOK49_LG02G01029 [Camellia lanceoleosa]
MNISQWNNNFKKIGLHSLSSLTSLWIQEDEEEEEVIVRYPHVHFEQSWGNIALGKLMFIMFIVSQFHGDLGLRQPWLEGEEYLSIVDEFMEAIHSCWPKAIGQFEDFQMKWAFERLQRYQKKGTAGVALAGLLGTVRAQDRPLTDFVNQKIVIVGAGSAELGVFNMAALAVSRIAGAEANPLFFLLDKDMWFYRYYLLSNFFVLNVNYHISLYYVLPDGLSQAISECLASCVIDKEIQRAILYPPMRSI